MKIFCAFFICFLDSFFAQQPDWLVSADTLQAITGLASSNTYYFMAGEDPQGNSRVLSFTHDGSVVWNKAYPFQLKNIISAQEGPVFFIGKFAGEFRLGETVYRSEGAWDGLCGALTPEGEVLWLTSFGGTSDDFGDDLCFSADGKELLLTGQASGNLRFRQQVLSGAAGQNSVWLARLSATGELLQYQYLNYEGTAGRNTGYEIRAKSDGIYLLADRKGKSWTETASESLQNGIFLHRLGLDFSEKWSQFIVNNSSYYGYECSSMALRERDVIVPGFSSLKYGGTGILKRFTAATGEALTGLVNENGTYKTCAESDTNYFIGTEEARICPCEDNYPGVQVLRRQRGDGLMEYLLREKNCRFKNIHKAPGALLLAGYTSTTMVAGLSVKSGFFLMAFRDQESSVKQEHEQNDLKVFPNPCTGLLQLQVPEGHNEVVLTIYDWSGRSILSKKIQLQDQHLITADLSLLDNGSYTVELEAGANRYYRALLLNTQIMQ